MSRQSIRNQSKYNQLVSQIQQAKSQNKQLAAILSSGQQVKVDHTIGYHSNRSFRTDQGNLDPTLIQGFVLVDADTSEADHNDADSVNEGVSIYSNQTLMGGFVKQAHYRTDYSESNRLRDDLRTALEGTPEDKRAFKQRKDQYRQDSIVYPQQLGYSDFESSNERQDGFSMMLQLHRAKS